MTQIREYDVVVIGAGPVGENIAQYAIDFMAGKLGDGPADSVWKKTELFHTDSVFCGLSALALGTNAPTPVILARNAAGAVVAVGQIDAVERSRLPDFVGALRYDAAWGSAQLSAAVKDVNTGGFIGGAVLPAGTNGAALLATFEAEYARLYGRLVPNAAPQVSGRRLLVDAADVQQYLQQSQANGADDPTNSYTVNGWVIADLMVDVFEQAAKSDDRQIVAIVLGVRDESAPATGRLDLLGTALLSTGLLLVLGGTLFALFATPGGEPAPSSSTDNEIASSR